MADSVREYKTVTNPFIIDSVEGGTDLETLRYRGRGEAVYSDGRQVLVRSCHDALVAYHNEEGKKGIILVRRKAEPAKGYLWPLGGYIDRGVPTSKSLVSRIKAESGLDVNENSLVYLGFIRAIWNTTPHSNPQEKGLPLGIDDTGLLYYCEADGELNLDRLHEKPLVVTHEMYGNGLGEELHPYVRFGMDRAIPLL
ncbi:hypothetical protein J4422_01810 [Candidatus Pacearchaeota archaeon]|nr:hypothetical protein [Candidatus Pacearchaeota archaeon]